MKRFGLLIMLFCGVVVFSINAQEKVLEEISGMDGVEVTYITKSMLKSMGKNSNMTIEGLNVSKIAKDLNSLQVLTAEDKSVSKVRGKLKSATNGMELIMKLKDDDECTDLYGMKATGDNYSKLFLCVDEGDEITVIYMTGNIGAECFNELSKKTNVQSTAQQSSVSVLGENIMIDLSDFDWENYSGSISTLYTNSVDDEIREVDRQIEKLYEDLSKFDEEEIGGVNSEIEKWGKKIEKVKTVEERDELYKERDKLFEKRNALFEKRNKFFEKRNELFEKRNKLFEKRNVLYHNQSKGKGKSKKQKNVVTIYRWDSNKKDFSITDGNLDLDWIQRVENLGVNNGYSLNEYKIEGTVKELSSVDYRIKQLKKQITVCNKKLNNLDKSEKNEKSEVYVTLLASRNNLQKRLKMLEEFYEKIYDKVKSVAEK